MSKLHLLIRLLMMVLLTGSVAYSGYANYKNHDLIDHDQCKHFPAVLFSTLVTGFLLFTYLLGGLLCLGSCCSLIWGTVKFLLYFISHIYLGIIVNHMNDNCHDYYKNQATELWTNTILNMSISGSILGLLIGTLVYNFCLKDGYRSYRDWSDDFA